MPTANSIPWSPLCKSASARKSWQNFECHLKDNFDFSLTNGYPICFDTQPTGETSLVNFYVPSCKVFCCPTLNPAGHRRARNQAYVLLVHYPDLKTDLRSEMRRIATFLDIDMGEALWLKLVETARLESMIGKTTELMQAAGDSWRGGGEIFLHKGTNSRWRNVVAR